MDVCEARLQQRSAQEGSAPGHVSRAHSVGQGDGATNLQGCDGDYIKGCNHHERTRGNEDTLQATCDTGSRAPRQKDLLLVISNIQSQ